MFQLEEMGLTITTDASRIGYGNQLNNQIVQENVTCQLSRDVSCFSNFGTFSVSSSQQNSFDQMRHYNFSTIYQKTRSDPNLHAFVIKRGNFRTECLSKSNSYCRENEYSSRPFESRLDSTKKMDVQNISNFRIMSFL